MFPMNYQNQYSMNYQPQIPLQNNCINSNRNTLLRVNGYEGARAFQMTPDTTVALFDANEDIFYVKTSDAGGFANIKAYSFQPVEQVIKTNNEDYVTRKEFEELKEMISNGKQFIQESNDTSGQQTITTNAISKQLKQKS